MAKLLPYYRWFTGDAKGDEKYVVMNDTQRGFFHRCLDHSWDNLGLPSDLDELAAVMSVTREYLDQIWVRVGRCWYLDGDRLFNARQEKERTYATTKSTRNASAAQSRYGRSANAVQSQSERSANGPQRAYVSVSISETDSFDFEQPDEERHGAVWYSDSFERWWESYWNKTAKVKARQAYEKRVKILVSKGRTHEQAEEFLIAAAIDDRSRFELTDAWGWRVNLNPPTWLNQERWNDQAPVAVARPSKSGGFVADVAQIMGERIAKGESPW